MPKPDKKKFAEYDEANPDHVLIKRLLDGVHGLSNSAAAKEASVGDPARIGQWRANQYPKIGLGPDIRRRVQAYLMRASGKAGLEDAVKHVERAMEHLTSVVGILVREGTGATATSGSALSAEETGGVAKAGKSKAAAPHKAKLPPEPPATGEDRQQGGGKGNT